MSRSRSPIPRTGLIGTSTRGDDGHAAHLPVLRLARGGDRLRVGRPADHTPAALPQLQHALRGPALRVRLPGGRVIDDQLRRRSVGAPAARSLLLTVLGEYVLPRPQGVWQETLVAALVSVGYRQQAARQALARSTRDGWLIAERRGRRARMTLGTATAELLRTGAERIYSFGQAWRGG